MKGRVKQVAFISSDLKNSYESLRQGKFEDERLYKFISRAIDDLKEDPFCGIRIRKRLIPKVIVKNLILITYGNITSLMPGDCYTLLQGMKSKSLALFLIG